MKKLILTTVLLVLGISVQAGGYRQRGHYSQGGTQVSFYWGGGYPVYSPWYCSSYYPSYGYGYDYSYGRPNYAVSGTLTGALLGGIIGSSAHHRGWEGAGIGAAAGLVLGSLAERNTRNYERSYYAPPPVSYAQTDGIANAPTVNTGPTIPAAPRVENPPVPKPVTAMSGANSLFGR